MVAGEAIEAFLPSLYEGEVYPVVPAMAPDQWIEHCWIRFGDDSDPRPSGVKTYFQFSNIPIKNLLTRRRLGTAERKVNPIRPSHHKHAYPTQWPAYRSWRFLSRVWMFWSCVLSLTTKLCFRLSSEAREHAAFRATPKPYHDETESATGTDDVARSILTPCQRDWMWSSVMYVGGSVFLP